jgi:hypothetical protein
MHIVIAIVPSIFLDKTPALLIDIISNLSLFESPLQYFINESNLILNLIEYSRKLIYNFTFLVVIYEFMSVLEPF